MNIKSLIMLPIVMSGASFMLNAAVAAESPAPVSALSGSFAASEEKTGTFAIASDLHFDGSAEKEILLKKFMETVNADSRIRFVIFLGDLTRTGSDAELREIHDLLSGLEKEYYVLPGNNDLAWSESGGETFYRFFGKEPFDFEYAGLHFMGNTAVPMSGDSGSYLHASIEKAAEKVSASELPVLFFTHTPFYGTYRRNIAGRNASALMIDALKKGDVQLVISGEGPDNDIMDIDGIPVLVASALDNTSDRISRFSEVEVDGKILKISDVDLETQKVGTRFFLRMSQGKAYTDDIVEYPESYAGIPDASFTAAWTVDLDTDPSSRPVAVSSSGTDRSGVGQVCTDIYGNVYALSSGTGKMKWKNNVGSAVFGEPAVDGDRIVVGSADGYIRCLSLSDGSGKWQYACDKAVLAPPLIFNARVFVGASDGRFRCLDLESGRLLWTCSEVEGPVMRKAYADKSQVLFADASNHMYCLSASNGRLLWKWTNHKNGKLPDFNEEKVAAAFSGNLQDFLPENLSVYSDIFHCGDKYFLSTPEDKLFALRDETGFQVWYSWGATAQVRLSADRKQVICLAPEGRLYAMNAQSEKPQKLWSAELGEPIHATDMLQNGNMILFSTSEGYLLAFNLQSRAFVWKFRVSDYPLKGVSPAGKNSVCVISADGKIQRIDY